MKSDTKPRLYAVPEAKPGATAVPPVEAEPSAEAPSAEPAASEAVAAPAKKPAKPRKAFAPLADPALDEMVRRADEDRWLASRFAPKTLRQRLTALYALNIEVATVADKVSEPRLGEIRLQWWRDTVEAIFAGGPVPDHPVTRALAQLRNEVDLPLDLLDALLTARISDLSHAPFETWSDVDAYIDATDGGVMRLAALLCAPDTQMSAQRVAALHALARSWGYVGLLRALPAWTAQQRTFFPRTLRANIAFGADPNEMDDNGLAVAAHAALDRAIGAHRNIERFASALSKDLFPAIGYTALTPLYIREQSHRELGQRRKPTSLLQRQLRLVTAAASR